jgi:hypothetical protein
MQTRRPQMPRQANGQNLPPFTASFSAVERDRLNHMRAPQETRIESSYGPTYSDDIGYYSDTPARDYPLPPPVNNSPPLLTGLGKWQNRKAKLWTELNPTISKDNTMGEAAQHAKMLAEFAKNRPCMFGVQFALQTSVEDEARPPGPLPPGVDLLDLPKAALDLRDLQCQYKFSSNRPESAT